MSDTGVKNEIWIVSGMSGSGKSIALRALEDVGYFCIDNLPLALFNKLIELIKSDENPLEKTALAMDSRDARFIEQGQQAFMDLEKSGITPKIIFLDSSDDVLIRRYKESRRTHPLAPDGSITRGIALERDKLTWLRDMAVTKINTSETNIHQLRASVQESVIGKDKTGISLNFVSFGYKYGFPHDTDLVLDVRFLPNPHWIDQLRPLTGKDERVSKYIFDFSESKEFLKIASNLLDFILPIYSKKGKHYLTLAIGCTGGKHRSVAIAEALGKIMDNKNVFVSIYHKDIDKA